jgi:hypothetical protein
VSCRIENHNDCDVTADVELILAPGANAKSVTVDGSPFDGPVEADVFFDSATARLSLCVPAGGTCEVEATCRIQDP